jgi:hypothetical protein
LAGSLTITKGPNGNEKTAFDKKAALHRIKAFYALVCVLSYLSGLLFNPAGIDTAAFE